MNASWCVIAVAGVRLVYTALIFVDADERWMRVVGRDLLRTGSLSRTLGPHAFAAADAIFTPHEWLYGVGLALATSPLAAATLRISFACCAIAALALASYRGVRRGVDPIAIAFCTMFAAVACFESYGTRPQVVGWLLFAAIVFLLEGSARFRWWIVPLTVFWANVHASSIVAPATVWLAAAGAAIDEGPGSKRTRSLVLLAAASTIAVFITPFGTAIVPFAFALAGSSFRHYILEWHRPGFTDLYFLTGTLPLLMIAVLRGLGSKRSSFDVLLFAMTTLMMFSAQRHAAFFAIAALPLAAAGMSERIAFVESLPVWIRAIGNRLRNAVPLVALGIAIGGGIALARTLPAPDPNRYFARDVVGAAVALQRPMRLACVHFGDCSFAIDSPDVRVLIDGRADPFPPSVWNDWKTLSGAEPNFAEMLRRRRIDAVITKHGEPSEQALMLLGGWKRQAADRCFVLYLRDPHAAPTTDPDAVAPHLDQKMPPCH